MVENQTIETAANEIEGLKKKYQNALNEILKLAKLIRIYGKYKLNAITLILTNDLETQYNVPSAISIRGRTTNWYAYKVIEADFGLDSFDGEGRAIYSGYMRRMSKFRGKYPVTDGIDDKRVLIYLIHD